MTEDANSIEDWLRNAVALKCVVPIQGQASSPSTGTVVYTAAEIWADSICINAASVIGPDAAASTELRIPRLSDDTGTAYSFVSMAGGGRASGRHHQHLVFTPAPPTGASVLTLEPFGDHSKIDIPLK